MNKIIDKLNVRINSFLCFIVLITLLFAACESKKKVEIKNNAGIVVESYFVDKKRPEIKMGISRKFYDDGNIAEVLNYDKNGVQNGEHTLYYPSGKIMRKEMIVNNKNNGKFISYYEDGNMEQEGKYKDNKMNGVWKTYSNDVKGALKYYATFSDGKYNGLYKEYYPNGKLFAEGNKIQLTEDLDVYDGKVQVYDSLGNISRVLTYESGKQTNKEEIKK